MIIEDKDNKEPIEQLDYGTAFWFQDILYMLILVGGNKSTANVSAANLKTGNVKEFARGTLVAQVVAKVSVCKPEQE